MGDSIKLDDFRSLSHTGIRLKVFLLLEGSLALGPLRNSSARVQYEYNYRIYVGLTHHRLRRALHHCSGRAVMGRSNTPYHDKLEVGICEACLVRASNKHNYYRIGPEEPPACLLAYRYSQKSTAPSSLQPSAPSDRRKAKLISIATCCEWHRKRTPMQKGVEMKMKIKLMLWSPPCLLRNS